MRLFTALDVPASVSEPLAAVRLPSLEVRWTPPKRYHVTLCFIGQSTPSALERYREALAAVEAPRARCTIYGLDVLPSRRRPRVLVAGLDRTPSVLQVHEAVADALRNAGASMDDRPFRPHITLGRFPPSTEAPDVHHALQERDLPDGLSFTADAFSLYESRSADDGVRYEARATRPLSSSA
jgi:2'-5' RNA ligase